MKKFFVISLCSLSLMACSKAPTYQPDSFINPDKTAKQAADMPAPKVAATFGVGNDPSVVKAYNKFVKNGSLANIRSDGFETFAYDPRSRPIVSCSPLHLCVVQLEQGETINDIQLGDTAHWSVNISLVGSAAQGSFQIAIKPKLVSVATDMVVTTTKRTYNIGLISQVGNSTHVVNFYYPEDTLAQQLTQAKGLVSSTTDNSTDTTAINVEHLNFNYALEGRNYSWRPTRVFDDGDKTYIQMPPMAERVDLPVLYIKSDGKEWQMINYRYKQPYYIVDGLFKSGLLVSGKGHSQQVVSIQNRNLV